MFGNQELFGASALPQLRAISVDILEFIKTGLCSLSTTATESVLWLFVGRKKKKAKRYKLACFLVLQHIMEGKVLKKYEEPPVDVNIALSFSYKMYLYGDGSRMS